MLYKFFTCTCKQSCHSYILTYFGTHLISSFPEWHHMNELQWETETLENNQIPLKIFSFQKCKSNQSFYSGIIIFPRHQLMVVSSEIAINYHNPSAKWRRNPKVNAQWLIESTISYNTKTSVKDETVHSAFSDLYDLIWSGNFYTITITMYKDINQWLLLSTGQNKSQSKRTRDPWAMLC